MDHVTNYFRVFIPLLLVCAISQAGYAQDSIPPAKDSTVADSICVQRDLPDLIRRWRGKSEPKKTKSGSLLLFPVVGSNPATGFMYGVAGQYAFQKPGANYSTVVGNATYTTKDQFMLQISALPCRIRSAWLVCRMCSHKPGLSSRPTADTGIETASFIAVV